MTFRWQNAIKKKRGDAHEHPSSTGAKETQTEPGQPERCSRKRLGSDANELWIIVAINRSHVNDDNQETLVCSIVFTPTDRFLLTPQLTILGTIFSPLLSSSQLTTKIEFSIPFLSQFPMQPFPLASNTPKNIHEILKKS